MARKEDFSGKLRKTAQYEEKTNYSQTYSVNFRG